jgi:hypothetical protein
MKKFFLAMIFALSLSVLFAERFPITLYDDGRHMFETTIGQLASHGVREQVWVKNRSSIDLKNLTCVIQFNGDMHEMQGIPYLSIGKHNNFNGQKDEEMKDEMEIFYGTAGKFSSKNLNKITFFLTFGDDNDRVKIGRVVKKGKDLCFEIVDK